MRATGEKRARLRQLRAGTVAFSWRSLVPATRKTWGEDHDSRPGAGPQPCLVAFRHQDRVRAKPGRRFGTSDRGYLPGEPDGTGPTNLTNSPAEYHSPSWSPEGTKIACSEILPDQQVQNSEIFVMNADRSGGVDLSTDPAYDFDPTWFSDGSQIAFTSGRMTTPYNYDIFAMNADGGHQHLRLSLSSCGSCQLSGSLVVADREPGPSMRRLWLRVFPRSDHGLPVPSIPLRPSERRAGSGKSPWNHSSPKVSWFIARAPGRLGPGTAGR